MSELIQEIRKQMMTTADFTDFSIKTPEQWKEFLHKLKEQPNLMRFARVEILPANTDKIPKIGFNGRLFRAKKESETFIDANQKKPFTEEVEIKVVDIWGEIAVSYNTLEDNIRGQNIKEDINRIMIEATARDTADLCMNGDITSADEYLAQTDGFLKRAVSHEYDFNNTTCDKDKLANTYRKLPHQYKRNRDMLRYIMSPSPIFDYQETLTNLATPMGDKAKTEYFLPKAMGIGFEEEPMIASYLNGTDENSKGLLTFPKNMIIGFHRKINIVLVDEPRHERIVFHTSARLGLNFEEEDAVVLMNNIKHKAA